MIIASWNCRGDGSRSFPQKIKDIINKYYANILCIIEPCVSGSRADKVCRTLGFSHWMRVEATGFSGGIWLLWNSDTFDITYLTSSTQLLHCQVKELSCNTTSLLTIVYGETTLVGRSTLWNSLRLLASSSTYPWLVLGDFNTYLSPTDKLGGADPPWASMCHFRECIDDTGLIEAGILGEKFTWERRGLKERLDWTFSNFEWIRSFPAFTVLHGLKFKSDHRVVMVNSKPVTPTPCLPRPFFY
ncbi:hypothetical protein QN277_011661 [Acacia crassicarpa]|uniref:Endonuclease/exonuclease/phosphatase domain-containing protein n=1 Tax=Acacia crassicarpa TaxID=499986 RepID=A0AAE1MZ11_9FABA|nr:hypothetical protein QN277_011661 [Acacia crassicarpa]